MTLSADLKADMSTEFLDTDEFADNITYTPKNGVAKTIPVIIDREQIDSGDLDQARVVGKEATIIIHNDATNGVTSIDINGDKVTFPPLPGAANKDWDVINIIESSNAHWKLLVTQ